MVLIYLADFKHKALQQHLDDRYTAEHTGDRCLNYQPGEFTRLPNRYYACLVFNKPLARTKEQKINVFSL